MAADGPAETGAALAFQQDSSQPLECFNDHIAKDPEQARRFASNMTMYQKHDAFNLRHLVEGYPWADLPDGAMVVDLGGSRGEAAVAVATQFSCLLFRTSQRRMLRRLQPIRSLRPTHEARLLPATACEGSCGVHVPLDLTQLAGQVCSEDFASLDPGFDERITNPDHGRCHSALWNSAKHCRT